MLVLGTIIAALVGTSSAHMAITQPCPRHSPNCDIKPPLPPGVSDYDYNYIKNPIPYNGTLCKSDIPWTAPVATWTAGQDVTYKFQTDGAAHGGGHCQFSLSYDGGKTFVVIHEELQYCFFNGPSSGNTAQVTEYTFKLPAEVPNSDSVIAAWTWVNAIGNREFYMNCADIKIVGSSSSSYTGKEIVIANHQGYPTIQQFNGNYETGLEYYKNAKQVTVTGNGGYVNSPPALPSEPSSESPSESSSELYYSEKPEPTSHAHFEYSSAPATTSSSDNYPAPLGHNIASETSSETDVSSSTPDLLGANGTSDECAIGAFECNADKSGFRVCAWGKWSNDFACGKGTVCKTSDTNAVHCGWP
ncbi:hypothetical protein EV183_001379 [Coemansia sp. RSA 2336]|nr:hypothetical protein EV183_001379 [Coemansia sp. RSA 2336]